MSITETDYCPLTGDAPDPAGRRAERRIGHHSILIPGRTLPPGTTDDEAVHAIAMSHAVGWSRERDGSVVLWVVM